MRVPLLLLLFLRHSPVSCLPGLEAGSHQARELAAPAVTITNGTIRGVYNNEYHQDHFLGIPYAQPPIQELRFSRPQPLNSTWEQPYVAQNYGPFCFENKLNLPGFTQSSITYPQNEDCLTINIVRPSDCTNTSQLPVLVWIHGGGFQEGGSGDGRYNMSYIVNASVTVGRPIIGVSMNYRLGTFGFISGQPFRDAGTTNLGIHDQRLALHWVQENIGSFGGDPRNVTIQGESAGAYSVGLHLLANNGTDEGLFHRAIAQSGSLVPFVPIAPNQIQDSMLENLKNNVGCSDQADAISCLRSIPAEALRNASATISWNPVIDGDLYTQLPSKSLSTGAFNRVPLLIGANTNEGTAFVHMAEGTKVRAAEDFTQILLGFAGSNLSLDIQGKFQDLYLTRDEQAEQLELGTVLRDPGTPYGPLYGSTSLLAGDLLIIAGRRITAEAWAEFGVDCYSYRFDTVSAGISQEILGATHFLEIPFVFRNTKGYGYERNPFEIPDAHQQALYYDLAESMSQMWINFVNTGSPNSHEIARDVLSWPKYTTNEPKNMVFHAGKSLRAETDNIRAESIQFISDIASIINK